MIFQNPRLIANEQLAPLPEVLTLEEAIALDYEQATGEKGLSTSTDTTTQATTQQGEVLTAAVQSWDDIPTQLDLALYELGASEEEVENLYHKDFLEMLGQPKTLHREPSFNDFYKARNLLCNTGLKYNRFLNGGMYYIFTQHGERADTSEPYLSVYPDLIATPFELKVEFVEDLGFVESDELMKKETHALDLCNFDNEKPSEVSINSVQLENIEMIASLAEKYKSNTTSVKAFDRSVKFLKIRNGRAKLLQVIRWWVNVCESFNGTERAMVIFDEAFYRDYIESVKSYTLYAYELRDFSEWSVEDFNYLVGACYNVRESTDTTSCMVKGDPLSLGGDYYSTGELHPFHAYMTNEWGLVLTSRLSYSEMLQMFLDNHRGDKDLIQDVNSFKGLFNGRAWAFLIREKGVRDNKKHIFGWYRAYGVASDVEFALEQLGEREDTDVEYYEEEDNDGTKVKMWKSQYGEIILPYIDGEYQKVQKLSNTQEQDGHYFYYGQVTSEDGGSDIYEPNHATGIADETIIYVECYITGEEIDREDAVWIDRLDAYVHYRYATAGELDAYAILEYFM